MRRRLSSPWAILPVLMPALVLLLCLNWVDAKATAKTQREAMQFVAENVDMMRSFCVVGGLTGILKLTTLVSSLSFVLQLRTV